MVGNSQKFYEDVMRMSAALVVAFAGCHFFRAGFAMMLALIGVFAVFPGKKSQAISIFVFCNFCILANPNLITKTGLDGIIYRATPLLIGLFLAMAPSMGRPVFRLPLGMLFPYLAVAAISSANGWAPLISYLKLLNFVLFFVGIWLGTQYLYVDQQNLYKIRVFCVAFCACCVIGSLIASRFPHIGYSMNVPIYDAELAAAILGNISEAGGLALFSGIFNQSQVLGVCMSCIIAYLLCDMLFVERRISKFHVGLIAIAFIETYMSRARVGLFSILVAFFMVFVKSSRHAQVSSRLSGKIRTAVQLVVVLAVIGGTFFEARNKAITRWIYKTNDASAIEETKLTNAITTSRLGLIDENMRDFRENKTFGKGFQVSRNMQGQGSRLVLTAPIEKGLLPLMILGETGVVGAILFVIFLFSFYSGCAKQGLVVSSIMFTLMLATNIGEATFFSSGGGGGFLWAFCCFGGFSLDLLIRANSMPPPMRPILGKR